MIGSLDPMSNQFVQIDPDLIQQAINQMEELVGASGIEIKTFIVAYFDV